MKKVIATLFTAALILFIAAGFTVKGGTASAKEDAAFTVVNTDTNYAWEYDAEQNAYASTNKTAGSSSSFSAVMSVDGDLSLLYKTSSEDGWDALTIYSVIGGVKTTVGRYSGEMAEFVPLTVSGLTAGDEVVFTYSKNRSKDRYEDTVYIKDLSAVSAVPASVSLSVSAEGYGQIFYGETGSAVWENLSVAYGSPVTLTAVAGDGYVFIGWKNVNGELITTTPDYTAAFTEATALTAEFLPEGFSLSKISATDNQPDWVQNGGAYSLNGAVKSANLTFYFAGEGCVSYVANLSSGAQSGFSVSIDGVTRYTPQTETNTENKTLWVKGSGAHALTFAYNGTQSAQTGENGVSLSNIRFDKTPQTAELKIDFNAELGSVYIDGSGVGADGYKTAPEGGKITLPLGVSAVIYAELTNGADNGEPWGWYYADGKAITDGQSGVTVTLTANGAVFETEQNGVINKVISPNYAVEARFNEKAVEPPIITRSLYIGRAESGVPVAIDGEIYTTDGNGVIKLDFPADRRTAEYYSPAIETGKTTHTVSFGDGEFAELTEVAEKVILNAPTDEDATKVYSQDGAVLRDFKLTATLVYYGGGTEQIALTAERAGTGGVYVYEAALTAQSLRTVLYTTVREVPASFAGFISCMENLREAPAESFLNQAQECYKKYLALLKEDNAADKEFVTAYLSDYSQELGNIENTAEITSSVTYGDGAATVKVSTFGGSFYTVECPLTRDNFYADGEGGALVRLGYMAEYQGKRYELVTPSHTAERRRIAVVIDSQSSIFGEPALLDSTAYNTTGVLEGDSPCIELYREEGAAVGSYAIYGRLNDPFYTADFTCGVFTVNKRPVTYTVDDKRSVYGDKPAKLTARLTEGSLVEGDRPVINLYSQVTEKSNVGEYSISATASDAHSYSVKIITAKYRVTPRPVTVKIKNQYALYGSKRALDNAAYSADGVIEGDDLGITLERREGASAGDYTIYGKAGNANYDIEFINGVYTVMPRPVTVTVERAAFEYGDKPVFSYTAEPFHDNGGLIDGDNLEISVTTERDLSVGRHALIRNDNDGNYAVTFAGAEEYEILPRTITVTVDSQSSVYGEALKELTYSVANAIEGEKPQITLHKAEGANAGEYAIYGECENGIYRAEFSQAVYTVTPLSLTVTVGDVSRQYGDSADLSYALNRTALPYGESAENLFAITREQGESVGRYAVTANALGNPNYDINFEYSDGANRRSYYEIRPRKVQISLNSLTVAVTANYQKLTDGLGCRITAGSTAFGEDILTLGIKFFVTAGGVEINAENCNALLKYGAYEITGECDNKNYAVTFVNGKLTVERLKVSVDGEYLSKILADYTFTGGNLLDGFVWDNEWKRVLKGYADGATQDSFSIVFKDKNGRELPKAQNAEGYAVPLAVSAGDYTAEIIINDSQTYAFSTEYGEEQSRVFPFEIAKMDISDCLKLNALKDNKVASGSAIRGIIAAEGYQVTPIIDVRHDGKAVNSFYNTGKYVLTARIDEDNYCAEKSFTVTVIPNIAPRIEELKELLEGYAEDGEAESFEEMRSIFSDFTADDELQIEASQSYKTVVEKCKSSYSEFLTCVGCDAETAYSVTDSRPPEALTAYALLTVFAGAAVAVKRY